MEFVKFHLGKSFLPEFSEPLIGTRSDRDPGMQLAIALGGGSLPEEVH
ncbi:hypothetical protein [Candidatus Poriferisocius sp.]